MKQDKRFFNKTREKSFKRRMEINALGQTLKPMIRIFDTDYGEVIFEVIYDSIADKVMLRKIENRIQGR